MALRSDEEMRHAHFLAKTGAANDFDVLDTLG